MKRLAGIIAILGCIAIATPVLAECFVTIQYWECIDHRWNYCEEECCWFGSFYQCLEECSPTIVYCF